MYVGHFIFNTENSTVRLTNTYELNVDPSTFTRIELGTRWTDKAFTSMKQKGK